MRCEDFPCCGHENGCCPSYDEDGNQMDMKCVCGRSLPLNNRHSVCDDCINAPDPFAFNEDYFDEREYEDICDLY